MDASSQSLALLSTGTGGTLLFVAYAAYRFLNHKQCRSRCCGQDFEASIDVGETSTPQRRPLSPSSAKAMRVNPMHPGGVVKAVAGGVAGAAAGAEHKKDPSGVEHFDV